METTGMIYKIKQQVNRIEVINHSSEGGVGRQLVRYFDRDKNITLSFQDGGNTLKIFIDNGSDDEYDDGQGRRYDITDEELLS